MQAQAPAGPDRMIYAVIIYGLFLAIFDQWASDTVTWSVAYFAVQYGFAAAISWIEAVRSGRRVFAVIGAVFAVQVCIELSYLIRPDQYRQVYDFSPAYLFTAIILIVFLTYEIINRWKKRVSA